jgi:hypothetical protein
MKIFELSKNKNSNSNIFPQTGFSRFLILAFKHFWEPMEKSHFFQKSKKIKISEFRPDLKNKNFGKKSSTKFLYPLGESMFKNSAISEMVTGRLIDSYKKPLLRKAQQ